MTSRKVLVTGGFGRLGSAVASAFERAGHRVAVVDLAMRPAGADARLALGGVDLTDPAAARRACETAAVAMGGLDVLVNVAGAFRYEPIGEFDQATWDFLFAANLSTCLNTCRALVGSLPDGGAIVNVGAVSAEAPGAGLAPYAAAKSAVARLTQSLAAELGGRVRVNAVLPGIIDTPANRAEMPQADPTQWTRPAAIADVILFLATHPSRAINGALIPVTNPA